MACNGCSNNCNCSSCVSTGCKFTVNTDCVIYNGDVLNYEPIDTIANSSRTLTELLEDLEDVNCCTRPSLIETADFELGEEHVGVMILLKATFDDVSGGTMTLDIDFPSDLTPFINKTLIFKDISGTGTGGRVASWVFSEDIQYEWSPSSTLSDEYSVLADATHKVLKLTLVKTSSTNYNWLVV